MIPKPVFGHGLVFLSTGYDTPTVLAIRPDGTGDVTDTHVAWTLKKAAPHTPSLLLVGDELYMVSDKGIATCLDAKTGERALAGADRRQLFGLAALRRRQDLSAKRRRPRRRPQARQDVREARRHRLRRAHARLLRRRRQRPLHPHRKESLPRAKQEVVHRATATRLPLTSALHTVHDPWTTAFSAAPAFAFRRSAWAR